MVKRGRPHKKGGSKKQKRFRKWWRKASAKYYKDNRNKVLRKARMK